MFSSSKAWRSAIERVEGMSLVEIIGIDNGLSPGRRQAIVWANAGILLMRTSETNFSQVFSEICLFSFK